MAARQLSGGEQQMLAISRALLANPRLLVMDEPTEGLAPVIVAQVEEMLVRLAEDGEMAVLVIEQNIGVACAVSENVAIMVNGRINRVIEAQRLAADRALQQRLLGVGRHGHDDTPMRSRRGGRRGAAPRRAPAQAPTRIYISNPALPTRWSQPVPVARIEAAARTSRAQASCRSTRRRRAAPRCGRSRRAGRRSCSSPARSTPRARSCASSATSSKQRGRAHAPRRSFHQRQAFGRRRLAERNRAQSSARRGRRLQLGDRGASVAAMAEAFETWISAPERHRGHHLGRRIGRDRAGDARDARGSRSACRRS